MSFDRMTNSAFVGSSAPMERVKRLIARVADADAPVLVSGDTGSGKEMVARALHHGSHRSNQPFLAVNCSALAETLLESEIIGNEKGAYTRAHDRRIVRIQDAHGGTLILEEFGDTSQALQANHLRVL